MSSGYTLSVLVDHGHWITLVSNKPMEPKHFTTLDQHLALQKEIFADVPPSPNPCQGPSPYGRSMK